MQYNWDENPWEVLFYLISSHILIFFNFQLTGMFFLNDPSAENRKTERWESLVRNSVFISVNALELKILLCELLADGLLLLANNDGRWRSDKSGLLEELTYLLLLRDHYWNRSRRENRNGLSLNFVGHTVFVVIDTRVLKVQRFLFRCGDGTDDRNRNQSPTGNESHGTTSFFASYVLYIK